MISCLDYLKLLNQEELNKFLYGVYKRGAKDGKLGFVDTEEDYCAHLAEKDAEAVTAMIRSETEVPAFEDYKKYQESNFKSSSKKPKSYTVNDFIYTLDYDVLVKVQKLKDEDSFYYFENPYAEELENKEVLSVYADKNENGEPVVHLVIVE